MRKNTNTAQLATRMATERHGKLREFKAAIDNVEDHKTYFLVLRCKWVGGRRQAESSLLDLSRYCDIHSIEESGETKEATRQVTG